MNLRKELKEDIWKIIEGKPITQKNILKFLNPIFSVFLDRNEVKMGKIINIAEKIKKAYQNSLEKVNDYILEENGEVLKVIKDVFQNFDSKLENITSEIEKWKLN